MKKELEEFFGKSFEELLKTKKPFTFQESINLHPELSIRAMVFFNLAKEGWDEKDEGYSEASKNETEYLSGSWM